tara:strand:+ start:497 stop:736 length:240 start_codon:yes stop_codon:yes gene_type:complete
MLVLTRGKGDQIDVETIGIIEVLETGQTGTAVSIAGNDVWLRHFQLYEMGDVSFSVKRRSETSSAFAFDAPRNLEINRV